jgi:hypothetical protein
MGVATVLLQISVAVATVEDVQAFIQMRTVRFERR